MIQNNKSISKLPFNMATSQLCVYILVLIIVVIVAKCDVIVKTESGSVKGKQVQSILKGETYFSFMGIPYAQPPVNKLRFMPPEPHPGWTDTLDATRERKPCAQFNIPVRRIKEVGHCGDEDCLYLSIHTPKQPASTDTEDLNLPVIVFLYNEAYRLSHNASKDYSPDFFMKEDVIVVTINHRLGALGFLSYQDDLVPGNNGLRDVILALKWLKKNVKKFAGDPNKFTLMGSYDGSGMADILLHSAKAKGLFSAVILQSGTSHSSTYFSGKPRERAIELSNIMDLQATTSSYFLRLFANIPAEEISQVEYRTVDADEGRSHQRGLHAFGPIVEHEHPEAVITAKPEDKPVDIDVPVMIGYNSRDALEAAHRFLHKPQYLTFADRDFLLIFPRRTNYHFKINDNIYYHVVNEIKEFYFDEGYVKISQPGEYITYLGDVLTIYHVDYTVRKYTNESKANVFYYMFDYSGELNMRKNQLLENAISTDGTWGASIGDELCYMFVCNPIRKLYRQALADESSEEIKVLKNMVKMWTNFAKTGDPTPPGSDFIWKPATREYKDILVISEELQMKTRLHDDRIKFWDEWIEKYRTMAVDGVVKDIKDEL